MSANDILKALDALSVTITAQGATIFASPACHLTDALRAGIRLHKGELLHLLEAASTWKIERGKWTVSVVCDPARTRREIEQAYPDAEVVEVGQSCRACAHHINPGQADGYCSNIERRDLLPAYGANHPAKFMPDDFGFSCRFFETANP